MVATWWAAKKTPYWAECLWDLPEPAFEADVSLGGGYGPHDLVAVVFGRWQALAVAGSVGTDLQAPAVRAPHAVARNCRFRARHRRRVASRRDHQSGVARTLRRQACDGSVRFCLGSAGGTDGYE